MRIWLHTGRRLKPKGLRGGRDRGRKWCPMREETGRATVTCDFPIAAEHRGHGDARQHPADQQENQRREIFPKPLVKGDTSFRLGGETAHTRTELGGEQGHETTFRPSQVPACPRHCDRSLAAGWGGRRGSASSDARGDEEARGIQRYSKDFGGARGALRCPKSSEALEGPTQTRVTQGCWRGQMSPGGR